jgi:hypothetical protein
MPGTTISRAHGTVRPADPVTGARAALVLAMYHPAAALRTPAVEAASFTDIGLVPVVLEDARARRAEDGTALEPLGAGPVVPASPAPSTPDHSAPEPPALDQLTLFR